MGLGWIFMVLFLGLLVLGVVALIRWLGMSWGDRPETQRKTPLQILQERYARGEIEREALRALRLLSQRFFPFREATLVRLA